MNLFFSLSSFAIFPLANVLDLNSVIMSYKQGIIDAITELKDRNGSSSIAIKKYMMDHLPADKKWINATFLTALKNGVASGEFLKTKSSFKLSADFKKSLTKKSAPKKAAPKKDATKTTEPKKKATTPKKATAKATTKKTKSAPKKAAPKKTESKKTAPKKSAPKKESTKKAPKKKAAPKKAEPKKAEPPKPKE
jgi:histone H1/5